MEKRISLNKAEIMVAKLFLAMDTLAFINSTKDQDKLVKIILLAVKNVMEVEASSLARVDTCTNELRFTDAAGGSEKIKNLRLKMGEGIAGHVAQTSAPMIVNDVRKNKLHYSYADRHTCFTTRSVLCVPLVVRGKVIGILQALNKLDRTPFNDDDLRIFNAFANQAAVALENARLYKMAIYDGLTGIFDRRYFDAWLKHEFHRVNRSYSNLSLIMMDIDFFKEINDNHGHQAGDFVLIRLVKILGDIVRKSDIFARYGGEEFMIALPDTRLDEALVLAEKYRSHVEGDPFVYSGVSIPVNISLGVFNTRRNPVMTVEQLIKGVDEQLYKAKQSGRNCVCYAAGDS